jgi:curved DNA-binding protein CbpA
MVNYYQILKVSPKASKTEIKSAYRRLARKLHPDKNNGSPETAEEFARIAKAYEILGNPKQRADYDKELLNQEFNVNHDSIFNSENQHAKRWRKMVYERRFNAIIDRMIDDERNETLALQKAIFPTVALFLSTCIVAIFKPTIWSKSEIFGRIILLTLFIIGVFHLIRRIRAAFERYTYSENIHDSILHESNPSEKPYRRFTAISFLVAGIVFSSGIGLLIGHFLDISAVKAMPKIFSSTLSPEVVFYPPIVVLLVDLMHAFVSKFDY